MYFYSSIEYTNMYYKSFICVDVMSDINNYATIVYLLNADFNTYMSSLDKRSLEVH